MPQSSDSVVVAAIQAAPVSFDLPKSLQKVTEFTSQAAAAGADLVVFPYGLPTSKLTKFVG
ncbi:nitrilase [Penicillium expansum]|nr:nitrilase [Penicillium expansum]